MSALQEITSANGELIALIVENNFRKDGVNFLSKETFPLQVAVSTYASGSKIQPHVHINREIKVNTSQEVVYIKRGNVVVDLYDSNKKPLKSVKLSTGDLIFFVSGGHGFEMCEDTTIVEVKQGPYLGKNKDKDLF